MKLAIESALPQSGGDTLALLKSNQAAPEFLGGLQVWPPQLRTLTAVMLSSRQPMFLAWGPARHLLYNDAYAAILGERHPAAFGRPFEEVWAEAWPVVGSYVEQAYAGIPTHMDDLRVMLTRHGHTEEAHFSFSYTPVRDDADRVVGLFCACNETTAAVAAEAQRLAEERRRFMLFQSAPGFMAILRGAGHVCEFANDAFNRLVGGRRLIGLTVRDAFPEIENQGFYALLDDVTATGRRFVAHAMPVRLQNAPDAAVEERYLDFVYEPITEADGRVTGIFVQGSDITEALRTRSELLSSHARHKELLESMGEAFVMMDEAFRLTEVNAAALRLDGRPASELLGRSHWELWPRLNGTPVEAAYRKAMRERSPEALEYRYRTRSHDFRFHIRVYPVSGGIACLYSDTSLQVATQTALRESEERFRAAVAAVGVVWTNDASGRMTGEQPGWSALTGQTTAEYEGTGWSTAVHPDDAGPTVAAWQLAVAERRTFVFEHRVRRHDGQWRRFAIRAVPVLDADGGLREWVGVHIDITDAEAAADALRAADRRKDEFLATLAHELRNPLAPIRTAAHLLGRPGLSAERIAWCGDMIRRQSQTMALLLDDLLEVSRITSGRLALKKASVGVQSVVDAAVETARPTFEAKGQTLDVSVPAGLPLIEVDPLRVSQVLINLLTNAAKYTDAGGRSRLEVRWHRAAGRGEMVFDVIDNGVGIAPEVLPRLFEMFHQVQSTLDRAQGGLGIGLALSKGLVELHGGRIEAFSAGPGRGATFRVVLPVGAPDPAVAPSQAEAAAGPVAAARRRVLVADDNVDAAQALAMVLELEGFSVTVAHDGLEAAELARSRPPDAALLDIGMPGLDGYRLAAALRSLPGGRAMLLIATTGWGQEEDKRRAAEAGFDVHLTKPVSPDAVARLLAERLRG